MKGAKQRAEGTITALLLDWDYFTRDYGETRQGDLFLFPLLFTKLLWDWDYFTNGEPEVIFLFPILLTGMLWDWEAKILGLGLLGIRLGRPFRNGKFVGEDIIRCPFISNGKLMKFGSITCQGPSRFVSLPFRSSRYDKEFRRQTCFYKTAMGLGLRYPCLIPLLLTELLWDWEQIIRVHPLLLLFTALLLDWDYSTQDYGGPENCYGIEIILPRQTQGDISVPTTSIELVLDQGSSGLSVHLDWDYPTQDYGGPENCYGIENR